MKVMIKSLLAIMSCTVMAVSISVPTIAQTFKDSQVESSSIGIGNKDYRNKQSTPSMVGSWKSGVNDNEYAHTYPAEIYFDMTSDGSGVAAFTREGKIINFYNESSRFKPTKYSHIVIQEVLNNDGEVVSVSEVRWANNNEFLIRLEKNPEAPHREGIIRRFVRIQEPVATQLQQRSQQAAQRNQRDAARIRRENAALRQSQQNFNNATQGLRYYPSGR